MPKVIKVFFPLTDHRSPVRRPVKSPFKKIGSRKPRYFPWVACLAAVAILLFLPRCAVISPVPAGKPLGDRRAAAVVAGIRDQNKRVSSFYARGVVQVKNWYGGSEADIFIVGVKDPKKFKIEITHPWGRPILHILIDGERLRVLSFQEKRLYMGPFTGEILSRFLPGDLNGDLIWAALRGYPNLLGHSRVASRRVNQITLFDDRAEAVEIIDLRGEDLFPERAYFPVQGIRLAFSDFRCIHGIRYAGQVKVERAQEKKGLVLRHKSMVFNRKIPAEIFTLDKPPAFECFDLEDQR